MADKTTTLKTKTNDNVYPNVIGDNRKNAFVDSSTITHHFYDKTHKVGFQINNETNIKIQNSLQKPSGLTKTELVGVGANGQENIEIGDNLTLANGKLSATGGDSIQVIDGTIEEKLTIDEFTFSLNTTPTDDCFLAHLHYSTITVNSFRTKTVLSFGSTTFTFYIGLINLNGKPYIAYTSVIDDGTTNNICKPALNFSYLHFITLTSNTSTFYFTYQNTSVDKISTLDSLKTALAGKYLLCTGHTDTEKAEYISGERGNIVVGVVDNSDNSTSGITIDSSFTITDDVTPVE